MGIKVRVRVQKSKVNLLHVIIIQCGAISIMFVGWNTYGNGSVIQVFSA